jgi:hypothetical protein
MGEDIMATILDIPRYEQVPETKEDCESSILSIGDETNTISGLGRTGDD